MTLKLYKHQIEALPIMKKMESEGKGGFLSDGMGLGKTITMCTYLYLNKIPKLPNLIVCPVSLIHQWVREIKRVYNGGIIKNKLLSINTELSDSVCNIISDYVHSTTPSILIFHGSSRRIEFHEKNEWDFIITTYSILGSLELADLNWGRVVLDESHYIKNGLRRKPPKCAIGAFISGLRSRYNWCISGTPFNNRMTDITSQCCFIGNEPYNKPSWWDSAEKEDILKWRKSFVLRRTKDGILQPPARKIFYVDYRKKEKKVVETLRKRAEDNFNKWKRSTGVKKSRLQAKILGLIQRLRVVTNSYYCGETDPDPKKVYKRNAKVNKIIKKVKKFIHKVPNKSIVLFSQFTSFLDILKICIKYYIPDIDIYEFNGSMNPKKRDVVVSDFNNSQRPRILLISLMAGNCGLNLMPCSTVFISEPYYNPFIEKQAEERVHRLGQKNQVKIYRFSVNNSIETWIEGIKSKKMFTAGELDLLVKSDGVARDFSFAEIGELFNNLVGFK